MAKPETHCQGCGELHHNEDMVLICIHCLQNKFIPRLNWLEVGFIDKKSIEQWWAKTKRINIKALKQQIELQLKQKATRAAFLAIHPEDPEVDEEELDLEEEYKKEFKTHILQ